jgi:hypothetical protein
VPWRAFCDSWRLRREQTASDRDIGVVDPVLAATERPEPAIDLDQLPRYPHTPLLKHGYRRIQNMIAQLLGIEAIQMLTLGQYRQNPN